MLSPFYQTLWAYVITKHPTLCVIKTLAVRLLQSCLAVCISVMRTHCSSLCSLFLFDWLLFDQSCLNSCLNIYVANCEDALWLWPNWQDINCSLLSTPCGRQVLPHAWQPHWKMKLEEKERRTSRSRGQGIIHDSHTVSLGCVAHRIYMGEKSVEGI